MSPPRSLTLVALALALVAGCEKKAPTDGPPPRGSAVASSAPAEAGPPAVPLPPAAPLDASVMDAATEPDDDDAYLRAPPRGGKSVGHTSVVLKLELANGKRAAFKPASRRGPGRYKGEIAARRLAVALGLPNVPRAFPRAFAEADLVSALGGEASPAGALVAKEAIASGGSVRGALIPWMDDLDFLPLENEPWWSRWRLWLKKGAVIETDVSLRLGPDGWKGVQAKDVARDASNLVAFDYLTANFDRWSGGNVGWDRRRRIVLFIDNDGAFLEPPQKEGLTRTRRLLDGVDRFSRSFVERLRAMDDAALARAVGEEAPGTALLAPKVLAGVAQRRKELLGVVDAKMKANGEGETLYFP